jgi:hypothetical protein
MIELPNDNLRYTVLALLGFVLVLGFATIPVSGDSLASENQTTVEVATGAVQQGNSSELRTASASFDTETGSVRAQTTGTDIELTQRLRRVPDRKGIFEASHRYTLPSELRQLEVTVPAGADVISLDGFIPTDNPRTHRWDGTTTNPGIEYRMPANRSIDQSGPIAGPGKYLFVDVGEWAVVSQPNTAHRWGWVGADTVGLDRIVSVDGPGKVGDVIAYLGEYDSYTHRAHGQRFELIVPERASLAERPAKIFKSLADASDTLRVGARDNRVFIVATPTKRIDWGVRGLQTGPSDIWVRDIERLDTADNVWLHEYVHSRQNYASAPDIQWFIEGGASYYAALFSLEQDRISFSQFRNRVGIGGNGQFGSSVLANPGSWQSNANYFVGTLVAGELDRRIRRATDRERSLQEVLRRMNAKDDVVTGETLRKYLSTVAGKSVATEGDRLTTTTARPSMWDQTEHSNVFGDPLDPARITFSLSESAPLEISGPYRSGSIGSIDSAVFVPGENVSFEVDVTNFGEQTGEYEALFRVNDEQVATRTGTLQAGQTETVNFEYRFEERGEYVFSVGDVELLASVRDPAPATIDSFSANRTDVTTGDGIELVAKVSNGADRPAQATVPFYRDGEQVTTWSAGLDVGAQKTATVETQIEEPGTYVFSLGEQFSETVVVTVSEDATDDANTSDDSDGAGVDDSGDGFGILGAVLAVVAYLGIRRHSAP